MRRKNMKPRPTAPTDRELFSIAEAAARIAAEAAEIQANKTHSVCARCLDCCGPKKAK